MIRKFGGNNPTSAGVSDIRIPVMVEVHIILAIEHIARTLIVTHNDFMIAMTGMLVNGFEMVCSVVLTLMAMRVMTAVVVVLIVG